MKKHIHTVLKHAFILFVKFFFHFYSKEISLNRKDKVGKPNILFGTAPQKSISYWAKALRKKGYKADTLVDYVYKINSKGDFDFFLHEKSSLALEKKGSIFFSALRLENFMGAFAILKWIIENYDILCLDFKGLNFFGANSYKWILKIIKKAGCKVVFSAYGGDFWQYSKITDLSLRHGLIYHYPQKNENARFNRIRIDFFCENADIILNGFQVDGLSHWDMIPFNMYCIDELEWISTKNDSLLAKDLITVVHAPNHRILKGTDFVIRAINSLKSEGYKINFILLEGVSNLEVKRIICEECDILVDQLIIGYGLNAIEGLAAGVPVLSNLGDQNIGSLFRRYSYLNECPILSSNPENIKENLKILIDNPSLRKELGAAGRAYVEKYHSEKAACYIFESIFEKIWFGKDIDLLNLFNPLNPSSYNNQSAVIEHPLIENQLPNDFFDKKVV